MTAQAQREKEEAAARAAADRAARFAARDGRVAELAGREAVLAKVVSEQKAIAVTKTRLVFAVGSFIVWVDLLGLRWSQWCD